VRIGLRNVQGPLRPLPGCRGPASMIAATRGMSAISGSATGTAMTGSPAATCKADTRRSATPRRSSPRSVRRTDLLGNQGSAASDQRAERRGERTKEIPKSARVSQIVFNALRGGCYMMHLYAQEQRASTAARVATPLGAVSQGLAARDPRDPPAADLRGVRDLRRVGSDRGGSRGGVLRGIRAVHPAGAPRAGEPARSGVRALESDEQGQPRGCREEEIRHGSNGWSQSPGWAKVASGPGESQSLGGCGRSPHLLHPPRSPLSGGKSAVA